MKTTTPVTKLAKWFAAHIRPDFILSPIATSNIKYRYPGDLYVGKTNVFIFGVRVAQFQRTAPWD